MLLTPTYHVMEMYNIHQDAVLLPVTVATNDFVFGSEKLPAVSVSASRDSAGRMHVSLVNIDAKKTQDVSVNLGGLKAKTVTGRILASSKISDHNTFAKPDAVKPAVFSGASLKGSSLSVKLPPFSVVVLEVK
jgi:alpha-N-arabinofuranosidase